MNRFGKITTSVTALVLVGCITITSVTLLSKKEVVVAEDDVSFNGTTALKHMNSEENPLRFVELVPSQDMGELSYIYDMEDWENNLRIKGSSSERIKYMTETLYWNWYGLFRKGNAESTKDMPLAYDEYSEVYALEADQGGDNEYHMLELANVEVLEAENTTGYAMKEVQESTGEYRFEQPYLNAAKVVEGDKVKYTGNYRQVVDQYSYSDKVNQNYGISFSKVVDEEVETTNNLYTVSQSWYFASEKEFNDRKSEFPNTYIYSLSYNNIYDYYTFEGTISELDYKDLDKDKFYYRVAFSYVDKKDVVQGKKYYKMDEENIKFFGKEGESANSENPGTGEYSANAGAPFIEVKEGEQGYFTKDELNWIYRYVGEGNGSYHFVKENGQSIPYDVQIGRIYYKGGYKNNCIWDKHVFNVKEGEPAINYDVKTMDPGMFNTYMEDETEKNIDLLYISGRSLLKENAVEKNVWMGKNKENVRFSKEETDISWETARDILLMAKNSDDPLAILVDGSVIDNTSVGSYGDEDSNVTNVQRVVALLSCAQFFHDVKDFAKSEIEITETTEITDIPWGELVIPWKGQFGEEYINQSVFIFYGDNDNVNENPALTPYIFKDFTVDKIAKNNDGVTAEDETKFKEISDKAGVREIADYIVDENYKRELENNGLEEDKKYGLFNLEISKATMIDYILSFYEEEEIAWDGIFDILEIQPGRTIDNKSTVKENLVKSALSKYNVKEVNITYMTSSEFVGKIEDLTNYDMIYFGLDTSSFNKKLEDGKLITSYNDESMNGLIYSNVGDILAVANSKYKLYLGMLDSDYYLNNDRKKALKFFSYTGDGLMPDVKNQETYPKAHTTVRYSGNDISREKKRDVENYVKAGYPVVVNNAFFIEGDKKKLDEDKIDNCSYMYDLIKEIKEIKKYDQVIVSDDVNSSKTLDSVMEYIRGGKPELTILNDNYVSNSTTGEENNKIFLGITDNTLELKFKVTNQGSANDRQALTARLYLDVNADGKFSKTQEEVSALDMVLTQKGEALSVKSKKEGEKTYYYYEVEPGSKMEYSLSYELPLGTVGVIPYKLVIGQEDNTLRTVSKQGYFYKKPENKDATIHVLQINTSQGRIESQKQKDQEGKDSESGSPMSFNMEDEYYNKPKSQFRYYMDMVQDFNFEVRTISSTEYVLKFQEYKYTDESGEVHSTYLDKFFNGEPVDMLILGFGDSYDIKVNGEGYPTDADYTKEEEEAMRGIMDYINAGKPVLFTHDTTSYHYDSKDQWGYEFNAKIRNLVGMDRYGVLSNQYFRKGEILTKSTNGIDGDFEKGVNYAINRGQDIPYVPKSEKKATVRQTQGAANTLLFFFANCLDGRKTSVHHDFPYNSDMIGSYDANTRRVKQVEQINQGQITSYPFLIPDEFSIAATHAQYYQLDLNEDMDKDGESDIVVWYTMKGTSFYDSSPKDVRNNYYIYTKGNVTYSGVGHYSVGKSDVPDEIKLYINTMVAAYNSGTKAPNISLKESADEDAVDVNTLYVSFDDTLNQNVEGGVEFSKDAIEDEMDKEKKESNVVYFTVTDRNIVKNLKERVIETTFGVLTDLSQDQYKKLTPDEQLKYKEWTIDGKKSYLKIFKPKISAVDGEHVSAMSSAVTYRAQIPGDFMGNKSNAMVYMIARTKFNKQVPEYDKETGALIENSTKPFIVEYSPEVAVSFTVRRIGLVDLD